MERLPRRVLACRRCHSRKLSLQCGRPALSFHLPFDLLCLMLRLPVQLYPKRDFPVGQLMADVLRSPLRQQLLHTVMPDQRCQDHIHVGSRTHHHGIRQLLCGLHRQVQIVCDLPIQIADIPCQDQLFLRPRERHIEHAQILAACILLHALRHHVFAHGPALQAKLWIDVIHTDAELHIHQDALPHIHLIELFGQPADKADRKFQSLALVDRHDAHDVRILIEDIGLPEVHLLLLYGLQIPDKMKQPIKARVLERTSLLQQQFDIRDPLVASRHGAHTGVVGRVRDQLLQQFLDRGVRDSLTVFCDHRQEALQLGAAYDLFLPGSHAHLLCQLSAGRVQCTCAVCFRTVQHLIIQSDLLI